MKLPTFVETALFAAFVAAMAFLVMPDFIRARDGYAIEMAAIALDACEEESERIGSEAFSQLQSTGERLSAIETSLASRGAAPLRWPRRADVETLDVPPSGKASISVRLHDGLKRVVSHRSGTENAEGN